MRLVLVFGFLSELHVYLLGLRVHVQADLLPLVASPPHSPQSFDTLGKLQSLPLYVIYTWSLLEDELLVIYWKNAFRQPNVYFQHLKCR